SDSPAHETATGQIRRFSPECIFYHGEWQYLIGVGRLPVSAQRRQRVAKTNERITLLGGEKKKFINNVI
ncbi:MAG: hypothetical protein ACPHCM_06170, partial [Arenicellales bacterium]